jgi:ATP-binding cassette, subfamily B, bacterial PglK
MTIFSAVWRLLDPRQRRRLIVLQLLSLLMAIATVGGIAAVFPFFAVLAEPTMVDRSAPLHYLFQHLNFQSERSFVVALGIAFGVIVALANAVNLIGSLMMNRFAFQVGNAFCTALFDEYLNRSFAFHSVTHSSILSDKVLHETGRVTAGILQSGLTFVTNLVTILLIVASTLVLNPVVAICAIAGLSAGYAAIYAAARGKLLRNGMAESRDYAARTKLVGESFGAIKEIILLRAQPYFVEQFTRCCESISKTIVSTHAIAQSPRHVLECAIVCSLVGTALFLSGRGDGTGPWIAQLSFIGLAAYRLLPALHQAFAAAVRIRADSPALAGIAADLRGAQANRGARPSAIEPSWRGRPRREILLQGASFRYAGDAPAAISNVTLSIPAGAAVGFVGANGSGKSTLIDLLTGLLVPQSGHLAIDGVVVDAANRSAWQSFVAYVPQQIYLLDARLVENIALGIPASQIDFVKMRSAVGLARLDECVSALPRGYDEMLGERGCRLSGGQRQRLGIARALYREASVLILDEATSALDDDAEQEIIDTLVKHRRGRTILLIAHRHTSLRHCDLVFELNRGAIVRGGSYDELMVAAGAPYTAG